VPTSRSTWWSRTASSTWWRRGRSERLFAEIFRVLRRGGRAVISDIVSDEPVPEELRRPRALERLHLRRPHRGRLPRAFEEAGFYGVRVLELQASPWRTVEGIEFRSSRWRPSRARGTLLGAQPGGHLQRPVQGGPGRRRPPDGAGPPLRGVRQDLPALRPGALPGLLPVVEPREEIPLETRRPSTVAGTRLRHPRETKGRTTTRPPRRRPVLRPGRLLLVHRQSSNDG
jgi:arsenite methyltransferase